jgi:alkaline phosphatase D
MKKPILISLSLILAVQFAFTQDFCQRLEKSFDPAYAPFYHGVASGDPLHDRVIIWTRVTPLNHGVESIDVDWFVATDTLFQNIVKSGTFQTTPEIDYTVKIDVDELEPYTYYYYYFHAEDNNSVVGRTKTAPTNTMEHLRFAFIHGSNYNNGYYNAYRALASRNDFEAVIHLGDYIYEYGTNHYGSHEDRWLVPDHEIVTLDDYRARYSHYHLDPDKRYIHQQYPWYVIWDDHEIANNSWINGAENHNPSTQGDFQVRRAAAIQAFFEWLPLRPVNDLANPNNHIRKIVNWGNLANIIFIDTRNEARMNPEDLANDHPDKVLLGEPQYQWLTQNLYNSYHTDNHRWRVIANQVMFVPLEVLGWTANRDQWDGYKHERQRLLNFIHGWNIKNTVILTGDIHTAWANDIPNPILGDYGNNGQGCIHAVEFICSSIASPSINFGGGIGSAAITWQNPHVRWVELENRGYSILDVKNDRIQADYFFIDNINSQTYEEWWGKSWYLNYDENFLREANWATFAYEGFPMLVSNNPFDGSNDPVAVETYQDFVLISGFPNPSNGYLFIQFHLKDNMNLSFNVFDITGKKIYEEQKSFIKCDIQYHSFDFTHLNSGQYLLEISNSKGERLSVKQFIIQ